MRQKLDSILVHSVTHNKSKTETAHVVIYWKIEEN